MKVAIMAENFSIGGAQRVVSELIKNLDQSRMSVFVICCGRRADTEMASDVEKIANVKYLNNTGHNIIKRYIKAARCLNEFNPDVIHAHLTAQLYAVPWGLLHKKKVIITAHAKPTRAFVKKIEPLIRWGLNKGKVYIAAVSQENVRLIKEYFSIPDERCRCINNGIDIGKFYRKPHTYYTYINVARQDENKNQAAILRCFAEIYREDKDIRLILVGDGPCNTELKELCRELSITDAVIMPGNVNDVAQYYAVSDVYVQSSHREGLPMSVLEAMAAGLPVVATNVGGMKDIVNGNGVLIPDSDEVSLLKEMLRMKGLNGSEYDQMSERSLDLVQEYSSKSMAVKYYKFYCD